MFIECKNFSFIPGLGVYPFEQMSDIQDNPGIDDGYYLIQR